MHSDFADALHELITPCKAYNKQATFTIDETIITTTVARDRALVERVFRRGQEWKYLHRTIPITETDIAGSCFFVSLPPPQQAPPRACHCHCHRHRHCSLLCQATAANRCTRRLRPSLQVIMMMTNYEPVMTRAKGVPLISTAETQWPVDTYRR